MTSLTDISASESEFVRRVAATDRSKRYGLCLDLVLAETAAVLGCEPSEVLPDRTYRDYGFSSLAGLTLTEQLAATCGFDLPLTMLFDHPSPAAVADYLLRSIESNLETAAESPAAEPVPPAPVISETDIAVVGMACRYPGGVGSPEQLWELVAAERDAVGDFPSDRGWDLAQLFHPDPDHLGTSYTRSGGFLSGMADFDAQFFGIGPQDAVAMDPQQRLPLEGTWELLEHAGIDPTSLRGSATGIFLGACSGDYGYLTRSPSAGLEGRWGLGMTGSVVSGRIAYAFGFVGPALTVDTACSSSLVAVHLAMQSLRRGESDLAVAGGVTVMTTPSAFVEFSRLRALAPDGRCKSFAEGADGTGWSEGLGLVLLERLGDARRNGHRVLGVLRGSAVNSDGSSNGLTAPSGPSQERVIRAALADAGLGVGDVDAVEAHGTGTTLGDPIEANALLTTYGRERPADRPLWLGSLKSNIGHTSGAAGVGGLIKVIMAMRHGMLPKTLHVDAPTSKVDWGSGAVSLLTEPRPWPPDPGGRPRRAGVSAFGVSGTNAHVIVEEPPRQPDSATGKRPADVPVVWTLSARTEQALAAQARQLRTWLDAHPGHDPADIAYSLATARAHLEHRAALIGTGRAELRTALDAFAEGGAAASVTTGRIRPQRRSTLAVMFPGQGTQYRGMGAELSRLYPVFATAYREICAEFDRHLDHPLEAVIAGADTPELLDQTGYTQPALFAVEVALYRLIESFGIRPSYLIGHSIGELVAAHVSGVLDLPDACLLVASRARLMQALPPIGAMVAVAASEEEIRADLTGSDSRIAVAVVNGPAAVVLSGPYDEIVALETRWAERGRRTKRLNISNAFHSPFVDPMLAEFADIAAKVRADTPRIPIVSNVTGAPTREFGTPEYWVRHVRGTVRFGAGIAWLADARVDTFMEVGPGSALSVVTGDCLAGAGRSAVVVPTLRRRRPEGVTLLTALAQAYVGGHRVDWSATLPGDARRIDLPTYPFQRQRYWIDIEPANAISAACGVAPAPHPLLDGALELPEEGGWLFVGSWSQARQPWLADHTAYGNTIVAGATVAEMAAHLGGLSGFPVVAELMLEAPLLVPADRAVAVQVRLSPSGSSRRSFTLHSNAGDGWIRNATATLTADSGAVEHHSCWPPDDAVAVDLTELYPRLAERGLGYGPRFQRLRAAWRRPDELFARIEPEPTDERSDGFLLHPGTFDATLHAALLEKQDDDDVVWLTFAWSGVRILPTARSAKSLLVRLTPAGTDAVRMIATDESGEVVASIDSVIGRPVSLTQFAAAHGGTSDSLFCWRWNEIEQPASTSVPGAIAVVGTAATVSAFDLRRYPDLAGLLSDIDSGATVPSLVLVDPAEDLAVHVDAADVPGETAAVTHRTLRLVQQWLADTRFAGARLVVGTRGAVSARDGEAPDPRVAAVWGLVRSAQTEHPNRFALADVDGPIDVHAVGCAVGAGISQLAVRDGTVLVPRLRPMRVPGGPPPWRGIDGSVLITGGTGGLGALVAEHLVTEHGVRRLILVSRRGPEADGARELAAELTESGAAVEIVACDVADRAQVAELIAKVRAEHHLRVVVHAAGVVSDDAVTSLTRERHDQVLRPKVDGAWHLHELTADLDLAAFVVFSSASGVVGTPGQANYAAANAFLDALAAWRRHRGLAGVSMAWGLWAQPSGMSRELTATDKARLADVGVLEIRRRDGLLLFDATATATEPVVIPIRLDTAALRNLGDALPPVLSDLIPAPEPTAGTFRRRLAGLPETERVPELQRLICAEIATVLRYPSPEAIDPECAFTDMGFDSLGAMELRNRLNAGTGLAIPTTAVFDYPTPEAITHYLNDQLFGSAAAEPGHDAAHGPTADELETMDAESLIRLALTDE
ncbi:type I polyketide synthase [Nocardia transvalensis]|uniref:type I polyketide synthase n=1 Tax=Nocardia transvalensis TaxID=37333 RepID=UPI0018935302|nr:type I polyketide synthase [Nocardia transvalensis]MBF6331948.1 SDR family NAD(P)-dependent oxidoreductase [Nocardia transvalensis]